MIGSDNLKEVYDCLNEYIKDNDTIVVALSGGPDSMALTDLLLRLNKKINLIACHVNHGLRKESDLEEIFVKNYCLKNNIVFEYLKIDNYHNNKFTEAEARKKRYDFFSYTVDKYKAKYLLTAHHGDDLIETVLMRIVRGSTLKGYSGISLISNFNNCSILRPLIYTTKDEIIKYLTDNKIEYVVDNSNTDTHYTRNRYRANMLPFLKEENKNVHLKFKKFSDTLLMYDKYVSSICKQELNKMYKDNKLYINSFINYDYLIQKRIIYMILENIYASYLECINDKHVEIIFNLINSSNCSSSINLPNNIVVYKEYGYINFSKLENNNFKIELNNEINLSNGKKISIIDYIDSDSNYECRLCFDEIKLPIFVRNKKDGDIMYVKGMNGKSKKVSDIFTNSKIPKEIRNSYPIVVDSNDTILWIPGIKKSKFDRTKSEKYDIILKYY